MKMTFLKRAREKQHGSMKTMLNIRMYLKRSEEILFSDKSQYLMVIYNADYIFH